MRILDVFYPQESAVTTYYFSYKLLLLLMIKHTETIENNKNIFYH